MSMRDLDVRGRKVQLFEAGDGAPLLYLHGIADTHGLLEEPTDLLESLAGSHKVLAPAHPGCAGSAEDQTLESMEDLVFHMIEVIDALGLDRFALAGNCIGGWLAAEFAVRFPERISRLCLISPSGLQLSGALTGDLFMAVQPLDGTTVDARNMLFADGDSDLANSVMADNTTEIKEGLMRYQAFRFAARVGFNPPYFYDQKLRDRLYRFDGPAKIVTGEENSFVPIAHAEIYASEFGGGSLTLIENCGHAVHLENADAVARELLGFLTD